MLIEACVIAMVPLSKLQFLFLSFRVRDVLIEEMTFLKVLYNT